LFRQAIEAHLLKLRARDALPLDEERAIRDSVSEVREYHADRTFIRAGEELTTSTLLIDGLLCRYKDLRSGERQITELHVAGDFADLHGLTLHCLDHDVVAMSDCTVAVIPHDRLREITREHPRLGQIYWFTTNVDAAIHRELALSLGQRSAISRMAHLFCELYLRLNVVGRARGDGYEFPLTQREISECLGLTVVHANRTLQQLRKQEVIEFAGGTVTIKDFEGLKRTAEFDPAYLYLERCPSR